MEGQSWLSSWKTDGIYTRVLHGEKAAKDRAKWHIIVVALCFTGGEKDKCMSEVDVPVKVIECSCGSDGTFLFYL